MDARSNNVRCNYRFDFDMDATHEDSLRIELEAQSADIVFAAGPRFDGTTDVQSLLLEDPHHKLIKVRYPNQLYFSVINKGEAINFLLRYRYVREETTSSEDDGLFSVEEVVEICKCRLFASDACLSPQKESFKTTRCSTSLGRHPCFSFCS